MVHLCSAVYWESLWTGWVIDKDLGEFANIAKTKKIDISIPLDLVVVKK